MSEENLLGVFPQKRIKPFDGMEITAEVWEQAHSTHRQEDQAHALFFHGAGIVSGLDVVASDPADQMVYILPGVAVDGQGRVILLPEPIAYDLGNEADGTLFLTITYRESEKALPPGSPAGGPRFTENEFVITARRNPPADLSVELARFTRESRTAPLKNAALPAHPRRNEIDLRFRQCISPRVPQRVTAAVVYQGNVRAKCHGLGMAALARELTTHSTVQLVVDDDLTFSPAILSYGMITLVGEGAIKFSEGQISALRDYLDHNGFLFLESGDEAAKAAFVNLCVNLDRNLTPVDREHPLLAEPFRFGEPCQGYEKEGTLLACQGVVLSTYLYGKLWNGESAKGTPGRETIRAAMEWGANLMDFVLKTQSAGG